VANLDPGRKRFAIDMRRSQLGDIGACDPLPQDSPETGSSDIARRIGGLYPPSLSGFDAIRRRHLRVEDGLVRVPAHDRAVIPGLVKDREHLGVVSNQQGTVWFTACGVLLQ
jgi:hypothetical protein